MINAKRLTNQSYWLFSQPQSLIFLGNTFERGSIFFDIHEATGFSIPFNPLICLRIKSLASFPYRSNTTPISIRFVYCHNRNRISSSELYSRPHTVTSYLKKIKKHISICAIQRHMTTCLERETSLWHSGTLAQWHNWVCQSVRVSQGHLGILSIYRRTDW